MNNWIISNCKNAHGETLNIVIENGQVVSKVNPKVTYQSVDATGLTVLPGLVDLHTHLREPGREDAETVLTGCKAAVAGGYTAISAMPNTLPVADTAGVVEQVYRLGTSHGLCAVHPIGAVTVGQKGEQLAELAAMNQSEAGVRVFSDDGFCVADPLVMRRALEYVKMFDGVIAQHAQEPRLTENSQMNEGVVSAKLGLKGWPAVAEEAIIARDILLAEHVQSRLHICHLTTAGGVALVRDAKRRGVQVTAEVTPHHLILTDEVVAGFDPVYKVNPPLRTNEDVMALREGLADGTIDIVATDHAPHPLESKDCEWNAAAFGMLGLETAFSVCYLVMVESGMMSLAQLVERMSTKPAEIARYFEQGAVLEGRAANLTLIDLKAKWVVDPSKLNSKSRNTPFKEMELPAVIEKTFHNGALVYDRRGK